MAAVSGLVRAKWDEGDPDAPAGRLEVLVCGFGGQGVLFAGELLGRAAVWAGLEAAESAAYGAESRGSACYAGVVISTGTIDYPKVQQPEVLVAMSQEGYERFAGRVKPGGRVFYDADLVRSRDLRGVVQTGVPASAAAEQMGRRGAANVVMAAAVVRALGKDQTEVTRVLTREVLEEAVRQQSPERFRQDNLRALEAGWKLGEGV